MLIMFIFSASQLDDQEINSKTNVFIISVYGVVCKQYIG